MRQRSFSIAILIVAFVLSAWGNVIAAAFCPRYASNLDCCIKHTLSQPKQVEKPSCHHEMAGMEMDDMQMESEASAGAGIYPGSQSSPAQLTSEESVDRVAFDLPIEQCAHCWIHSQPTSGSVSLVSIDPSKRLIEMDALPANPEVVSPLAFSVPITPSEHSPPGTALPRHVLINVFRI